MRRKPAKTSGKKSSKEAKETPLKIVFAASEAAPFVKTGGLADVAGSLPKALSAIGCDVIVVIPLYGSINREKLVRTNIEFRVSVGNYSYICMVFKGSLDERTPVYFLHNHENFSRSNPYGDSRGDYPDNDRRFVFFNRAVLELLRTINFEADIIHANDWHLGLVPVYLKQLPKNDFLGGTRSVLSLHNLAYQGLFPATSFQLTGLPEKLFSAEGVEMNGSLAFLKSGILFADGLTAVSPSYAKEILTPELGFGLDKILQKRKKHLTGILNGVDTDEWNPKSDRFLPARYGHDDTSGKRGCRTELLRRAGFDERAEKPVISCVSRLIEQKGFDMVVEAADELMRLDIFLVVLGTGQYKFEDFFRSLMSRHRDKVFVEIGYDNQMAHLIEAGSDFFLMPSLFEPCGLNQMFSMMYGTPPIVRATGGLKDSVEDWNPATKKGTGFVFNGKNSTSLLTTVKRALKTFKNKREMEKLILNGMSRNFSWEASAKLHAGFYKKILS